MYSGKPMFGMSNPRGGFTAPAQRPATAQGGNVRSDIARAMMSSPKMPTRQNSY